MLALKIWIAVLLLSALPFLSIAWLWKRKAKSRMDWALALSLVGALSLLAFIAVPWATTSYYLRYVLVVLFALAAFFSYGKVKANNLIIPSSVTEKLVVAFKAFVTAFLALLNVIAIKGIFIYPVSPIELTFPLSEGVYYVIQGGNSTLTNPFHKSGADNQEEFALDIVKLNRAGNRSTGIYPQELNSYAIYGAIVYSPCDGEIIELVDGTPDNSIGDLGRHPSNHIVIRCEGVRVTLAHMMSGSFAVRNGQFVREGEMLGRVGNSGHTAEPHLHIDAVRDFVNVIEPLPVSFNGRLLSTNSVVIK
jgi:hypothetical protein